MLLRSGGFDGLAGLVEWLWVASKSDRLPAQAPGAVAVDLNAAGPSASCRNKGIFLSDAGERHGIRGSGDLPWAVRISSVCCHDGVNPLSRNFPATHEL